MYYQRTGNHLLKLNAQCCHADVTERDTQAQIGVIFVKINIALCYVIFWAEICKGIKTLLEVCPEWQLFYATCKKSCITNQQVGLTVVWMYTVWAGFPRKRHWGKDLSVSSLFGRWSREVEKWGGGGKPTSTGGAKEISAVGLGAWLPWRSLGDSTGTSLGLPLPKGEGTRHPHSNSHLPSPEGCLGEGRPTFWLSSGQRRPPAVLEAEAVSRQVRDRKFPEDTAPAPVSPA